MSSVADKEKFLVKLKIDPKLIERKDLEFIDDIFIKDLSDKELTDLDERLHEIYSEIGKVTEPLHNAHIFVWKEMIRRNIPHEIEDKLTDETALEVIEYPTPRGFASKGQLEEETNPGQGAIKLEDALKAFPEQIIIYDDPAHVHLVGRIVNTGISPEGHDIDILFKQAYRDDRTIKEFLKAVRRNNPELADRLHFVFDPHGPQVGYSIPVFRLSYSKLQGTELVKHSPWEYLKSSVKVGTPVRLLKAQTGFKKFEFFDPKDLWYLWAAERIEKGIVLQKKYDGMRFQIHKKGDKIWIITEDRLRDRADIFKKSVQEMLENIKEDGFILDAEMVEYDCKGKKVLDKEEVCEALPREEMIPWVTVTKKVLDDENIVFHIHDCLAYKFEDVTQKGYQERLELAKEVLGKKKLEHWRIVSSFLVKSKAEFDPTLSKVRRLPGSEGSMLKVADSIYKLTGRTSEWAKIKNVKEIDVMVWERIPKINKKTGKPMPGQWTYTAVFQIPCSMKDKVIQKNWIEWQGKCYFLIGETYSTSEKCEKGDIITVKPIRVAEFEKDGKLFWTWMFPWFSNKHPAKKEPDTLDTVRKLVEIGTKPLTQLSDEIIILKVCPFWVDDRICPLKNRFAHPMDNLTRKRMILRFPVACPFADFFKCRFVKPYYYGLKEDSGEKSEDN